jgi:hypothetical protein
MKRIRFAIALPLLLATSALADEAADRIQIQRLLVRLNTDPLDPQLFTAGFEDRAEVTRLFGPAIPTVKISHEPFGEASIVWPVAGTKLMLREIRFLTNDIAVAEAALISPQGEEQAVLVVARKQRNLWRISSVHGASTTGRAPGPLP